MSISERIVAFAFGVMFLFTILYTAIFIPNPTPFQVYIFRIVLALTAAGIGGIISGFIGIATGSYKFLIRAGGAITLFLMVYFFSPPLFTENQNSINIISKPTLFMLSVLALFASAIPLIIKYLLSYIEMKSPNRSIEIKTNKFTGKVEVNNLTEEQVKILIDALYDHQNENQRNENDKNGEGDK